MGSHSLLNPAIHELSDNDEHRDSIGELEVEEVEDSQFQLNSPESDFDSNKELGELF